MDYDATRTIYCALSNCIEQVHSKLFELIHLNNTDFFDQFLGISVYLTFEKILNLIFHPLSCGRSCSCVRQIASKHSGFSTMFLELKVFNLIKFFLMRYRYAVKCLLSALRSRITSMIFLFLTFIFKATFEREFVVWEQHAIVKDTKILGIYLTWDNYLHIRDLHSL